MGIGVRTILTPLSTKIYKNQLFTFRILFKTLSMHFLNFLLSKEHTLFSLSKMAMSSTIFISNEMDVSLSFSTQ